MSSNKNIEDIFQSGFEGFTKDPSDKVWSGINKKMQGPRMENLYKSAFNGFRVTPSEQVWKRIAAFIWVNKFIHFSPFTFNIYYLAVITTFIVGTGITINNNYNKEFVHFSEKITNVGKTRTNELVSNQQFVEKISERDVNTIDFELSAVNNNDSFVGSNTNIETTASSNSIIAQNNTQVNSSDFRIVDAHNSNAETLENNNYEKTLINDDGNTLLSGNEQINLPAELKKLARLKYYSLSYSPTALDIADAVMSGIPKLDEIKHDTVGVDYLGDPILVEKSYFTVDFYFSTNLHNYTTTLLNQELSPTHEFYKNNIKTPVSFSTGIGVGYSYNNLRFETGIGYHRLNESLTQKHTSYVTSFDDYFDYSNTEIWSTETIFVLDLDEYLQGNEVYVPYIDSTLTYSLDSSQVTYADSVKVTKYFDASSAYHFVDVPMILGYELGYENVSITPKFGIISSMLINRTGRYYNIIDNKIGNPSEAPNTKFLFDYYGAVNFQYKLNKNTSLYLEPFIRGDINSMYEDSYAITQKSRRYGIRTGICFKF